MSDGAVLAAHLASIDLGQNLNEEDGTYWTAN